MKAIAWETEVGLSDAPDHLIHYGGDRVPRSERNVNKRHLSPRLTCPQEAQPSPFHVGIVGWRPAPRQHGPEVKNRLARIPRSGCGLRDIGENHPATRNWSLCLYGIIIGAWP